MSEKQVNSTPEEATKAESSPPEPVLTPEPLIAETAIKPKSIFDEDGSEDEEKEDSSPSDVKAEPLPVLPWWKRCLRRPSFSKMSALRRVKGRAKPKVVRKKRTLAEYIKDFFSALKTITVTMVFAFAFRSVLLEPFTIPSGSMIPTLLVGDYLFVSKYSYGYSYYSFPFSLPIFKGRIFASEPERGDVAVFRLPRDTNIDYIKRVIGLPGDRVQMKGGRLFINGVVVPRKEVSEYRYETGFGSVLRDHRYVETLPGGVEHVIIENNDYGPYDNTPEYVVPEGHYFMMGDNRDNSLDSRANVGFVPLENFIGRAEFTFYSFDDATSFWQVWEWPWAVRWERLIRSIGPIDNADGDSIVGENPPNMPILSDRDDEERTVSEPN